MLHPSLTRFLKRPHELYAMSPLGRALEAALAECEGDRAAIEKVGKQLRRRLRDPEMLSQSIAAWLEGKEENHRVRAEAGLGPFAISGRVTQFNVVEHAFVITMDGATVTNTRTKQVALEDGVVMVLGRETPKKMK